MKAQVNDLDAVANELKVNGVDRAIVPITNRHRSKNTNRRRHKAGKLDRIYKD
jgi:hypothetical protein